ncbi:MAG: cell division protein BolA [unclassified Hahellaceae]|nr:cell division protein BolA [Hahellaceae bacterium]|tara:strand:+ start:64654 stop:64896 length:243 start_codon:yes stop_codon:yes gene_type:complete
MQPQELENYLQPRLSDCEVKVGGDDYHFLVTVIGDVFEDLNAVKKQQYVYKQLNELIADGTVHAVTIKTYTPTEWSALNS